jgi:Retrotransposon gag protein
MTPSLNNLSVIRQRSRPVREYAAEFAVLAVKTGYDNQVLLDTFVRGLDYQLQNQVALRKPFSKLFLDLAEDCSRFDFE